SRRRRRRDRPAAVATAARPRPGPAPREWRRRSRARPPPPARDRRSRRARARPWRASRRPGRGRRAKASCLGFPEGVLELRTVDLDQTLGVEAGGRAVVNHLAGLQGHDAIAIADRSEEHTSEL